MSTPTLLQDECRELSRKLSNTPDAMTHAREAAQSIQQGVMLQPGTKARKVGGKFEANGTIVAAWIDPDDGKPRYAFRFDFPAGMTHFYTAEQVRESQADDPVGMSPLGDAALVAMAIRHIAPKEAWVDIDYEEMVAYFVSFGRVVEQAHDIR